MIATVLIAAGLGGLVHLIILLVIGGIAVINKWGDKRRQRQQKKLERRLTPANELRGRDEMETNDVDQFLDEMLNRPAGKRPAQLRAAVPEAVVLRPARAGVPVARPVEPRRGRPAQPQPRPQQQTAPSRGPKPLVASVAPPRSDFAQQINTAVDQAANAATAAGALQPTLQPERAAEAAATTGIAAMLRTPANLRQAFLLSQVFGPPRALRRRRRI